MSFQSFHSKEYRKGPNGFGLVELTVSIGIMVMIMGIVFARQDGFNSTILLRNQAYEVALHLREVQLNAVSATSLNGEYRSLLGINFTDANSNNYSIYADANENNRLDAREQTGPQGVIDPRFEISRVTRDNGTVEDQVNIIFQRPDFDAVFYNENGTVISTPALHIEIRELSTGETRSVEVTSAGQIRVEPAP